MQSEKQFTFLIPLSMFYISLMIFSDLLVSKPVAMQVGLTTAATLIFPLWFILNNILAEKYGRALAMKVLLTGYGIQMFFNLISHFIIQLPSPTGWPYQSAFDLIVGRLLRIELITLTAFFVSGFLNIYLITRWKIILSGKYFWLRCVGSSIICEALYSLLNVGPMLFDIMDSHDIFSVMIWSFLIKVIYTSILAYPALLLIILMGKNEDSNIPHAFNPFQQQA